MPITEFTLFILIVTIALSIFFSDKKEKKKVHPPMRIKKMDPNAIIPSRGTEGAAGYDLYALEDIVLTEESADIKTGIAMEIPLGYVGIIKQRSSMRKYTTVRAGVIDADYRLIFL
jgi:dUTP pyrophosphatase